MESPDTTATFLPYIFHYVTNASLKFIYFKFNKASHDDFTPLVKFEGVPFVKIFTQYQK